MLWIQAAVVWLLIGLAVASFVRSEMKPLNADELKISASDLRTFSRTTQVLLDHLHRGDLTANFFHSQLSLVRDKVTSERKSLESSTAEGDVEQERAKLTDSAKQLESAMQIVDAHPDRSAQSEHDLEQLYQTFKNTEDQLTAMSEAK
jgi:hypothetical protein